jgi:hypothetical protein
MPEDVERLKLMAHLAPSVVMEYWKPARDILPLVELLHPGDEKTITEVVDQWKRLQSGVFPELSELWKKHENLDNEPEKFWFAVMKLRRIRDVETATDWSPFGTLAKFALEILALPHPNAKVDRWFDVMHNVKSRVTYGLSMAIMNAILVVRSAVKVCIIFTSHFFLDYHLDSRLLL